MEKKANMARCRIGQWDHKNERDENKLTHLISLHFSGLFMKNDQNFLTLKWSEKTNSSGFSVNTLLNCDDRH